MEPPDLAVRNATYRLFVELGRAPTSGEVAVAIGFPESDIRSCWSRLHDAHALVLNQAGDELRMASPLSAVPTAYRVRANGSWW